MRRSERAVQTVFGTAHLTRQVVVVSQSAQELRRREAENGRQLAGPSHLLIVQFEDTLPAASLARGRVVEGETVASIDDLDLDG